ncbi:MAG: signal peptidase I [Methanobacterium sp.]|nr:signal peptidase I [Methanobacterium sp.]
MDYKEILKYVIIIIIGIIITQHMNVVASPSMEPVLHKGDIIFVDSNVNNIQIGDIIVYYGTWTGEPLNIVHRVIEINQKNGTTTYITKGDNNFTNPCPDPVIIYPNDLRYKLITINKNPIIMPKIGYISLFFQGKINNPSG